MQVYGFALCSILDNERGPIERLGYLALPNDDEAIAFAKPIAEELAQANGEFHGAAVKITSRKRHVSSIPVQSGELKRLRA